ncbi:MAG: hypothetical protein MJ158_03590, partial [Alphaproteobacteria bacterium]|nr:hypothetical protein [Alphaproteobacteria bacterium]
MKRNILFWTYFIIAVVLAVYFASRFVTSYLGYGPVSKVHAIVVTPSDIIDTENIQKQLYIKNNSIRYAFNNLEFFNKNIRDNYPNVKNTAIRIMPNGDININLEMYTPVAIWTKDNVNYYPITADGKKINTPTTTPETNSLVFKGILPNDLSK